MYGVIRVRYGGAETTKLVSKEEFYSPLSVPAGAVVDSYIHMDLYNELMHDRNECKARSQEMSDDVNKMRHHMQAMQKENDKLREHVQELQERLERANRVIDYMLERSE